MHIAGRPNGEELLKWMIKHREDLDLNAQDQWQQTALFYAKTRGAFETLIDHGVDVHARNYLNQTAIFSAVIIGNTEIIKSAVAHGIDVNAQNINGKTALFITAREKSWILSNISWRMVQIPV
ncbi:MAG: ankyrin repeat domain-containing protein [Candidatus Cardinium sp.]|uniref:ankyrin repeat domain-containing protein n=1 Tax=Cardinium endosymbiont of Dermatophagoides farinae TaxID=2597823 RepID=UPI001CB8D444|nr:ankyrin repeat domain-containing protein [Cardinium endosymbiont of Dermatophagoides farinae]UWW97498.1 MAG: ankyrin repeat domain-containing protein [Candidatus Cardinium sp.]